MCNAQRRGLEGSYIIGNNPHVFDKLAMEWKRPLRERSPGTKP